MAGELALLGGKASIPSYIGKYFADEENITPRTSVPSLSYEGKNWAISIDGTKTKLMRRNEDGDEEPVAIMRVIVLDQAKRRGRSYYEGTYDPGKVSPPLCWSDDGITPDSSIPSPQASACGKCPRAVKGDRITDQGKQVASCSQHRMVAVLPAGRISLPVLRMKLAITSLYDKQSPELQKQGWFAFDNLMDMLAQNGVKNSKYFVIKMRFDPNTAYPKVLFSLDRWLTDEELAALAARLQDNPDEVTSLLGGTWTPAGVDGKLVEQDDSNVVRLPPQEAKTEPKVEVVKPRTGRPPKAAEVVEKVKPADDDDGEIILPGTAKPEREPEQVGSAVAGELSSDVEALLKEWD